MTLERLWAGWRSAYISTIHEPNDGSAGCVMCHLATSTGPDREAHVVAREARVVVALNAYPYSSGHLMVLPVRHVGDLEDLDEAETAELWAMVSRAVGALKRAYRPDGLNVGLNLGRAAGAGVPGHLHVHVVPRWNGDANFMTAVAETRVLPESLLDSWERLRAVWEG